jgi:hypothetical protein
VIRRKIGAWRAKVRVVRAANSDSARLKSSLPTVLRTAQTAANIADKRPDRLCQATKKNIIVAVVACNTMLKASCQPQEGRFRKVFGGHVDLRVA